MWFCRGVIFWQWMVVTVAVLSNDKVSRVVKLSRWYSSKWRGVILPCCHGDVLSYSLMSFCHGAEASLWYVIVLSRCNSVISCERGVILQCCHGGILPYSSNVILPRYRVFIIISCRPVKWHSVMLSCHFTFLSRWPIVIFSQCQKEVLSCCNDYETVSYFNVDTVWFCHIDAVSCYHVDAVSCYHAVRVAYCHNVMLSWCGVATVRTRQ